MDLVAELEREIRSLKKREKELEGCAKSLSGLLARAHLAHLVLDESGIIRDVNRELSTLLGYSGEEAVGRPFTDFLHPDGQKPFLDALHSLRSGEEAPEAALDLQKKDGGVLRAALTGMRPGDENDPGIHCILHDITELAQAEKQLEESTGRFRFIIENSPFVIALVNPDGSVALANPAFVSLMGYGQKELTGLDFTTFTHPDDLKKEYPLYREILDGKRDSYSLEKRNFRKDGSIVWLNVHINTVRDEGGRLLYFLAMGEDITARKEAEDTANEARRILELFCEAASDYMIVLDQELRVSFVSRFEKGLSSKDVIGRPLYLLADPAHREGVKAALEKALRRGITVTYETEFERPDGSRIHYESVASPISDGLGARGLVVTSRDVTDRKMAEMALRESEEALQQAQEAAKLGSWSYDVATDRPKWSKEMFRIFRWDASRGEPCWEEHRASIHPDDWARLDLAIKEAVSKGKSYRQEFRIVAPDGSVTWAETNGRAHGDESGRIVKLSGTVQDITERKLMEEQLLHAQKMDSIGRLAGGVAHDFNNMLAVILGHADIALEDLNPSSTLYHSLQEIREAASRSAEITRQLLAFARKQNISPKRIDLNEALQKMLKMLRRIIGENIELSWNPGEGLWPVKMDPVQIDQMLANLCINARDAISDFGKITIETGNFSVGEPHPPWNADVAPGDYVRLTVRDNGCGMDEKTLDRIFEPFFTTKPVGKGTGLGLSTVYGIVRQNKGFINTQSEPGRGTSFQIFLPRIKEDAEEAGEAAASSTLAGVGETLLLVEDEKAVLGMARSVLERLGYRVLVASTPGEAVRLAEREGGAIELLITDMVMPEMNGWELARELRSRFPGLRCLFMSGYSESAVTPGKIREQGYEFLQKPFTMGELSTAVRQALEK